MADGEIQNSGSPMTTGKAITLYAAGFFVMVLLLMLVTRIDAFPGGIAFFAYLIIGFLLNRIVLRGLIEWHPMYNTLANVSSAKLGMMLLWPIRYPVLFFQLLVSKHL